MTKQKLCFEHGHILGKKVFEDEDEVKWELVNPEECNFCKLQKAFNTVLNQKEFRDLKP